MLQLQLLIVLPGSLCFYRMPVIDRSQRHLLILLKLPQPLLLLHGGCCGLLCSRALLLRCVSVLQDCLQDDGLC
jgi:hypothetical protein